MKEGSENQDGRESVLEWIQARVQRISDLLDELDPMSIYRGKLTPKQVAEGMNAASRNARRLLEDAEMLFEAKRYPSAAALAILSIEEQGKAPVLRSLAVVKGGETLKNAWKSYRSHQTKNVLWLFPLLVLGGARTLSGFGRLFDPNSKHPRKLDELKQMSFYTDCFGKGVWSEPREFVDEAIAGFVIKTARSLTKEYHVTEREIELWIKHVGPNLEKSGPKNLKAFWDALHKEGLATRDINEVDAFLGLTPGGQR